MNCNQPKKIWQKKVISTQSFECTWSLNKIPMTLKKIPFVVVSQDLLNPGSFSESP